MGLVDFASYSEGQAAGQQEIDAEKYYFGHIALVVASVGCMQALNRSSLFDGGDQIFPSEWCEC